MPLISVIVPVYNIEQYLPKCIESIINQSYENLQIILVDDGSTDSSGCICDEYSKKDKRIVTIHKKNGGLVSARKAGIDAADGEYVGFVDGDDYIEQDMYKVLLDNLLSQNVDFVHSGFMKNNRKSIYGTGGTCKYCISGDTIDDILTDLIVDIESDLRISPSIWSKLFKKKLIADAYRNVPDTQSYGEDLLCLCRCVLSCKQFLVINQAYYHYVIRDNSISHERDMQFVARQYELYHCLCDLFKRNNLYTKMQGIIEKYFITDLSMGLQHMKGLSPQNYQYPDMQDLLDKRIVIYGAGDIGQDYYAWISRYERCSIAAWVDSNAENITFDYCKVLNPEELRDCIFDVIVIAVMTKNAADAIKNALIIQGVSETKIIWRKPALIFGARKDIVEG